jgi:hypothetical protein
MQRELLHFSSRKEGKASMSPRGKPSDHRAPMHLHVIQLRNVMLRSEESYKDHLTR